MERNNKNSNNKNSNNKNSNNKNKKSNKTKKPAPVQPLPTTVLSTTTNVNTATISGLKPTGFLLNFIAAFTGLFIFLLGPYVVNTLGKPITAACFNLVPTGVIMGLFVSTEEFPTYFTSLLFVPTYNVIMNLITYWFYKKGYLDGFQVIVIQIGIWLGITALSFFIP